MLNQFSRTEMLIGEEGVKKLSNAKIAIFGIGGVGSYVAEALARCGIGSFILVDNDKVTITNINRQIIATTKTIGQYKVDLMEQRILDINPNAKIEIYKTFYMPDCKEKILDNSVSYVIDAIDTVTAKIFLIEEAIKLNIPVISSMGTGNKFDPSKLTITDIRKTSYDPLAKIIRKYVISNHIKEKIMVVSSVEPPIKSNKVSSIAFVPASSGILISSYIINDILKNNH